VGGRGEEEAGYTSIQLMAIQVGSGRSRGGGEGIGVGGEVGGRQEIGARNLRVYLCARRSNPTNVHMCSCLLHVLICACAGAHSLVHLCTYACTPTPQEHAS
jgi:hypothetical protein